MLGGGVMVLYMCGTCKEGPVDIANWVRCCKAERLEKKDQTVAGQRVGHWRCPQNTCMARRGGSDDWSSRLLLVPREDDDRKYNVYYIGFISPGENNILTALKGGELMKECYDQKLVT